MMFRNEHVAVTLAASTASATARSQAHLDALLLDQAKCRKAKGGYCHWSEETKEMCAAVYLAKPSAYSALREAGGTLVSTSASWVSER